MLCQQVLAAQPDRDAMRQSVVDRCVQQTEILLLLIVADGSVETVDVLQPSIDGQALQVVIGTNEALVVRCGSSRFSADIAELNRPQSAANKVNFFINRICVECKDTHNSSYMALQIAFFNSLFAQYRLKVVSLHR